MLDRLALIGFGEAAATFAAAGGWRERACAYDVDPLRAEAMRDSGVRCAASPAEALAGASLVLCLVTADQALAAASDAAPYVAPGAIWCDMNSVAPQTKREAALAVQQAGARYVDVAILAPVQPAALAVPLLLAGEAAAHAEALLRAAGFSDARVTGDEVGRASAIKMIRSVMVKGMEALTAEMMAGAHQAGVVAEVLASLDASETRETWRERTAYQLERMARHGMRRAAEMEESAKTLEALGVEPIMTRGTVRRQRAMAGQELPR